MKKRMALICLVTICLTGCSDNTKVDDILGEFENDNTELGIYSEWDGVNYEPDHSNYAETTTGFYYYSILKGTMMYLDKKTGSVIPVCTKVECDHKLGKNGLIKMEDITSYIYGCDAIYYSINDYQAYNGKLYVDTKYMAEDSFQALVCSDFDGTDRKEVIKDISIRVKEEKDKVAEINDGSEILSKSLSWKIYNDKVYVVTGVHIVGYDDYERHKLYIDVYDLNTGDFIEQILYKEYDNLQMMVANEIYVTDEYLVYCAYASFYDEQGKDKGDSRHLIRVDFETKECVEANLGQDRTYASYFYVDDKIIFNPRNEETTVYTLDAYGKEEAVMDLTPLEVEATVLYRELGDYIMVQPFEKVDIGNGTMGYYVKIYDKEYNYLDSVYFTNYIWASGGGHDVILFSSRNDNEYFYYVDTSDIGRGNLELKKYEQK